MSDYRDIAIAHVTADLLDARSRIVTLTEAMVELAYQSFGLHQTYLRVLRGVDDARLAAVRDRDRLAEECARLKDQYEYLRKQILRSEAA
ncbi:MAG TPA: hypothetical protein VK504_02205 [Vicinamibacterales bacterium]|nr:hypothetical protein [Vicinamibacterales bacterium]